MKHASKPINALNFAVIRVLDNVFSLFFTAILSLGSCLPVSSLALYLFHCWLLVFFFVVLSSSCVSSYGLCMRCGRLIVTSRRPMNVHLQGKKKHNKLFSYAVCLLPMHAKIKEFGDERIEMILYCFIDFSVAIRRHRMAERWSWCRYTRINRIFGELNSCHIY